MSQILPRLRGVLVAALGMGVPVIAGLLLGHADAGFAIGLGAVLLSGASTTATTPAEEDAQPWAAIIPAMLAVTLATLIAGHVWTDAAMIGLASVAALLSGYSRPVAIGAIRFGIYLVLGVGFLDDVAQGRHGAALVFGLGALWNIALRMLLVDRAPVQAVPAKPARVPTPAQRRAHFRKTLRTLAGWQFAARLAIGLSVASVIRHAWPDRHFFWIMLTVALLTQRVLEHLPTKTVHRLLGTILGVGATWIIVANVTSLSIIAICACVLAALVPLARARSYLLYSIVVTPLILLVSDLGKPIAVALLTDRIVATIIGGVLVVAGNVMADWLLQRAAPTPRAA